MIKNYRSSTFIYPTQLTSFFINVDDAGSDSNQELLADWTEQTALCRLPPRFNTRIRTVETTTVLPHS